MSLISFIKEAGEKLFGSHEQVAAVAAAPGPDLDTLNNTAADAIVDYINTQGLNVTGLTVKFDGASGAVDVFGVAADQETKEKVVLCCGNVQGVLSVNDNMSVDQSSGESQYVTVVHGDTLSGIAKRVYDNANKYPVIFEANKPMLTDPNKIYPGQVLRCPPL